MQNNDPRNQLPTPLKKNDKRAAIFIWSVSIIVFLAVALLAKFKLVLHLPFNVHIFALFNAIINSLVAILLLIALLAVKNKNYKLHRNLMLTAIILSVLFLVSYVCHHLLAGETKFGDLDHNNILSDFERSKTAGKRFIYYILLATHIPLAAIILPFILFTAYRSLSGDFVKHKKLARLTWPIWFYVAVSGVLVYYFISPYYS